MRANWKTASHCVWNSATVNLGFSFQKHDRICIRKYQHFCTFWCICGTYLYERIEEAISAGDKIKLFFYIGH